MPSGPAVSASFCCTHSPSSVACCGNPSTAPLLSNPSVAIIEYWAWTRCSSHVTRNLRHLILADGPLGPTRHCLVVLAGAAAASRSPYRLIVFLAYVLEWIDKTDPGA